MVIQNDIMRDFLDEHGSEAENMLFEEWNWEKYTETRETEAREAERTNIVRKLAESMNPESISKILDLPIAAIQEILSPAH